MLDLLNVNVGGGGFNRRAGIDVQSGRPQGVKVVSTPRSQDTDEVKFAKKVAKVLDVSEINHAAVAAALWENTSDGTKYHLYLLIDALLDVAADVHEANMDYSITETDIGTAASAMRKRLTSRP